MVGSQVRSSCGARLVLKCADLPVPARPCRPRVECRVAISSVAAKSSAELESESSGAAKAGPAQRPVYWGVHTGNHRATVRPPSN
jgi:hypothetical protein